jgi:hypothetical protein
MLLVISSFSLSAQAPRINRNLRGSIPRMESSVARTTQPTISEDAQLPAPAATDSIVRSGKEVTSDSKNDTILRPDLSASLDSAARADSIAAAKADSIALLTKSSLESPAFSTARDSIIEDFTGGKQMIYYYGDVTVTYGNMKLTADYMEYDLKTQTLFARGTKDTTGVITGMSKGWCKVYVHSANGMWKEIQVTVK